MTYLKRWIAERWYTFRCHHWNLVHDNPCLRYLDNQIKTEWRMTPQWVNGGGFKPFWSHNLTPGAEPVYVDSAATKKKLMKKYGLREAGDRQGGAYRTSTSGMGWKKAVTDSTGVRATWQTSKT